MTLHIHHEINVPGDFSLQRLDQAVANLLPQYSRSRLQQWIKSGNLTVNGKVAKSKDRVYGGEKILVSLTQENETDAAEDIPLRIVFEDEHLLVINKQPGLVVHPGAGNPNGTLLNALLNHAPELADIPRAGIVHRLDKETSGLMVVARTLESQHYLVKEIQARRVSRIYDALVYGQPPKVEGSVDGAIGRNPKHRKKMAVRADGKPARTHYQVLERFADHSLVQCRLETGRTHQIRVHMQSLGCPIIGDPTYGGHYRRSKTGDEWLDDALKGFGRQALHAKKLGFVHPVSETELNFKAEHPEDFRELLELLNDQLDQA